MIGFVIVSKIIRVVKLEQKALSHFFFKEPNGKSQVKRLLLFKLSSDFFVVILQTISKQQLWFVNNKIILKDEQIKTL